MQTESATIKSLAVQRTERRSVRHEIRTGMRMPLDVRRIDSERYIVQPKIVAAHRATISVSAEHFGQELAMPLETRVR